MRNKDVKQKRMEHFYNENIYHTINQYFATIEDENADVRVSYDDQYYIRTFLLEKEILSGFALPDSPKYHLFLSRTAQGLRTRPANTETLYYELCIKAEEYLSKNKKSIHHLVEAARKFHQNPFEVLPEMLVHINSYTLYIYNEILLKSKDIEENIVDEFRRISHLNCLSEIYMLCFDKNYERNELYKELIDNGLRYITPYLRWYHAKTVKA